MTKTTQPHTITLFPSSLYELSGTLTEINPFPFFQQTHDTKKEDLPQFSPCTFEDNSRARDKKRISLSLLVLDMDSSGELIKPPKSLHKFLDKHAVPHIIYTTSSHTPEKPRYRIIIPLDQPIPATSWKRFVPAALDKFHLKKLWPYLDHCTLNPASIFRLAPKTSIFFTGQHPLIPITIPPEPDLPPPTPLKLIDQDAYTKAAILGEVKKIADAKKGERNATLNTSSYALGQLVGSSDLAYEVAVKHLTEAANQAGLPDFEARRVIKLGLDQGAGNPRKSRKPTRGEPILQAVPDTSPIEQVDFNYMGGFMRTKKGGLKSNEANAAHAFNHPDLENILYYNEFSSRICIEGDLPWTRLGSQEWADTDDVQMSIWLQNQKIELSSPRLASVVTAVAQCSPRHPVREYLESLEWDNTERIDTWLTEYLGTGLTAYSSSVGVMWLVSAVARVYEPGCQTDHMLVLEGPQGEGKSTILRNLTSSDWFTDELPDFGTKDAAISLAGRWIVEVSELDSFRKAEANAAKAFISRRIDRYRPPYGRRAMDFPRQNIFAGTTNSTNYLKDPTGDRRYWPVKCGAFDPAKIIESRGQIWAETLARYKNGEVWWPNSKALAGLCSDEASERNLGHPLDEAIEKYIVGRDEVGVSAIFANLEILPGQRTQGQLNIIAAYMQKMGWTRKRVRRSGSRVCVYVRPQSERIL